MTSPRTIAAAAALAAALSAPSWALATMQDATIQDGDQVDIAPDTFSVVYDEPVALAALTLSTEDGAPIPLPFTPGKAASFTVVMPDLQPGAYVFALRGQSDDGHVAEEQIHFIVTGADAFFEGGVEDEGEGEPTGEEPADADLE